MHVNQPSVFVPGLPRAALSSPPRPCLPLAGFASSLSLPEICRIFGAGNRATEEPARALSVRSAQSMETPHTHDRGMAPPSSNHSHLSLGAHVSPSVIDSPPAHAAADVSDAASESWTSDTRSQAGGSPSSQKERLVALAAAQVSLDAARVEISKLTTIMEEALDEDEVAEALKGLRAAPEEYSSSRRPVYRKAPRRRLPSKTSVVPRARWPRSSSRSVTTVCRPRTCSSRCAHSYGSRIQASRRCAWRTIGCSRASQFLRPSSRQSFCFPS